MRLRIWSGAKKNDVRGSRTAPAALLLMGDTHDRVVHELVTEMRAQVLRRLRVPGDVEVRGRRVGVELETVS